jgi:predicted enzyme related to lactoylglutathione lyase
LLAVPARSLGATEILKQEAKMILGLRTATYPTPDPAKGKAWYSQVLGCGPYFDEPFYVGFSVGGFEPGLIPDGEPGAAGVQAFWGVPDAAAELARLEGLGAQVHEPVKDVGGIKVASVRDPFGNLFSIIENSHFTRDEVR